MTMRRPTTPLDVRARRRRRYSAGMLLVVVCAGGCVRAPEVERTAGVESAADAAVARPRRRSLDAISRGAAYAGIPLATSAASRFEVLANEGYTVGYSEERRSPLWAAYQLFRVDEPARHRTPHAFIPDARTAGRIEETCYADSGYARGRLAPSYAIGTRYGAQAQRGTLLMSNVSPRVPKLDRETWRALERVEADDYAQAFGRIWVITGPIFDDVPETLPCGVAIPNSFYRIIVAERDSAPIALPVIMTQEDDGRERLRNFTTTIDQIESLTGLDFFPELPREVETALESSTFLDTAWDVDRMLEPH